MIRALIVDDSKTMQEMVRRALESDPDINIVKICGSGQDAINAASSLKPDVITMDVMMPGMDGLEATRRIMHETPTPIVIVSSIGDSNEQRISFKAMEAGAVWVVTKPQLGVSADWDKWSGDLRKTVKSMSEVKVVSRRSRIKTHHRDDAALVSSQEDVPKLIAVAASTGGPNALLQIFEALPENFSIPILVCQHITRGFAIGFTDWLRSSVKAPVCLGEPNAPIRAGITVSPDTGHLEAASQFKLGVVSEKDNSIQVPSADVLFKSVAIHFGKDAVGIILTGMGRDGCKGMGELWKAGALTIAQDKESSLVYGMPQAAQSEGYAKYEMNLDQIKFFLLQLHRKQNKLAGIS